jgi:hypothetical protein
MLLSNDKFPIGFENLQGNLYGKPCLITEQGVFSIHVFLVHSRGLEEVGILLEVEASKPISSFASTIMSTIGLPLMKISREQMKSNPLKFVLQLFPTRFAYHYHRSHGSLAYFNEME